MNTPYICQRCIRRIAGRTPQTVRRKSHVPLSKTAVQEDGRDLAVHSRGVGERKSRDSPARSRQPGAQHVRSDDILETLFNSNRAQEQPTRSRYSRTSIQTTPSNYKYTEPNVVRKVPALAPEYLLASASPLPEPPNDSVKPKIHDPGGPIPTSNHHKTQIDSLVQDLSVLKGHLVNKDRSLVELWHHCVRILASGLWKNNLRHGLLNTDSILSFFRLFLFEVARQGVVEENGTRITPDLVISVYVSYGSIRFWWDTVLWIQLAHVMEAHETTRSTPLIEGAFMTAVKNLMRTWETLVTWFNQLRFFPGSPVDFAQYQTYSVSGMNLSLPTKGWKYLPGGTEIPQLSELPRQLRARFRQLIGDSKRKDIDSVVAAAMLTLHYLEKVKTRHLLEHSFVSSVEPFMKRLRLLADDCEWDASHIVTCLRHIGASSEELDIAKVDWTNSQVKAVRDMSRLKLRKVASVKDQFVKWTEEEVDEFFAQTNTLKDKADASAMVKLWEKTQRQLTNSVPKDEELRSKIYARFLRLAFEVRQNGTAIDVWNHMISVGHKPGLRHWNAMLSGCGYIRDLQSLHDIWTNMLKAGVQPDNETWTSYIHGAIRGSKGTKSNFQQGLQLLEQLGREWQSPKNDLTPSLGPIHGALSAFSELYWSRTSTTRMHQNILSWARAQGIRPTTQTYNILLQPIAKHASPEEIQAHLASMAHDSCDPDIYTYTILLQGPILNPTSPFHALPAAQQTSTITTVLSSMAAASLSPSPQTYSTILFGLLDSRSHAANPAAARAVLTHMESAGVQPSQHIHTILLTHYFATQPPDLGAVEALLRKLLHTNPRTKANLNGYFWNRLVSGYADCDEWEKALFYLRRLPKEGKAPSWTSLARVLRALERAGERGLCGEVVEGVEGGSLLRWAGSGVEGAGWKEYVDVVEGLRGRNFVDERREGEVEVRFSGWGLQREGAGG